MTKEQTTQRILDIFKVGTKVDSHTRGAIAYALQRYAEEIITQTKVKVDMGVAEAVRKQLGTIYEG